MDVIPHFINGQFVKPHGDKSNPVYNPATGEKTAEVIYATKNEVEAAILNAKNAFISWSQTPPLKRARVLFEFRNLIIKNSEKLAKLITLEHGKTVEDAKGEVSRALELLEFTCGTPHLLKGEYSENVGGEIDTYTIKQPLGVCVGISPFNFPLMISTWMFAPAIACGNSFILKPSEKDPSSTLFLGELLQEAGLPNGVFQILNGNKETVDSLITHPDISAVSSVGSTPVSKHIYETAVLHGKRAHTFGGAKNHCVVMPDADLEEAASAIVGSAYGAAGERCMAISVVVAITNQITDQLIEKLKNKIHTLKIASGLDNKVDMGPLVTKEHLLRVKSYVNTGVEEGAILVCDGRSYQNKENPDGFFMGACLFDHVTPEMKIYQDEIFGPVLCVVRAKNFENALSLINQNPYGNGVSIFTRDGGIAKSFAASVTVGMIGINVPIPVPVAYHTFGGWKQSIFGDIHMHGIENVRFYTREKTVLTRFPKESKIKNHFEIPTH